jgi:hypothetical protein
MANQEDGHDEPEPHRISEEDREWIRRRLKERKMSVRALGDALGQTRQAIYLVLDGTTRTTEVWPQMVKALGGTPPSGPPPITDERLKEIVRRWQILDDEARKLVHDLAKRLSVRKP